MSTRNKFFYFNFCLIIILLASLSYNFYKSDLYNRIVNLLIRKDFIHLKNSESDKRIVHSNYYALKLMRIFPPDIKKNDSDIKKYSRSLYGGIEVINDKIFFVDGNGSSFIIDGDYVKLGPELNIPNHKKEFNNFFKNDFISNYFGIKDVLIRSVKSGLSDIYVSTTDFNIDGECYFISVFKNQINDEYKIINNNWSKIFETKPCLPKHRSGVFLGQSAGGKLAGGIDKNLYLTTGDFYFDGVNDKNILQSNESDYGKVFLLPGGGRPAKPVAQGLRNPQGLYFYDNLLYESEHGPQGGDEVNLIRLNGVNVDYGWPAATFGVNYGTAAWPLDLENKNHFLKNVQLPIYSWIPSIGISNILVVDKLSKFQRWSGNLLVSSLRDKAIYRLALNDKNSVYLVERIEIGFRIRDLVQHKNSIYLLEDCNPPNLWKLSINDDPSS